MPDNFNPKDLPEDTGSYVIVSGKVWLLERHPTDFSIMREYAAAKKQISGLTADDPTLSQQKVVQQLAIGMSRVSADSKKRDVVMDKVREKSLAHHVYKIIGTNEELEITDRIILTMPDDDPEKLLRILQNNKLVLEERCGRRCILRVTEFSKSNPLRKSNEIRLTEKVESVVPEILFPTQLNNAPVVAPCPPAPAGNPALFGRQWYLASNPPDNDHLDFTASIKVCEAWKLVGPEKFKKSEIVIAVIDDGFDLGHPAFKDKTIVSGKDFVDGQDPLIDAEDRHGTCVASLALANGGETLGVAPGCAFQPLRVQLTPSIRPDHVLAALEEANKNADVANCSFSFGVSEFPFMDANDFLLNRVKDMIANGGRRKRGLVIVFAAGNQNVPLLIDEEHKEQNKNGVIFKIGTGQGFEDREILKNKAIHTGYTELDGVVVVGAMSSLKRKAFYSNWGSQLTVVAPSNNFIQAQQGGGTGLDMVAATNRLNNGKPLTDDLNASHSGYTQSFGGTSAAAAIVSGVIGLMLSVNDKLSPQNVLTILKESADREMNKVKLVDREDDPNLQDNDGKFDANKRSLFFGSGKVDAAAAVLAAKNFVVPAEPHN